MKEGLTPFRTIPIKVVVVRAVKLSKLQEITSWDKKWTNHKS